MKQENQAELEKLSIQGIMSTENGRHTMWTVLEQSGVFTDCFDPDPIINAKNSGARCVGVWLMNVLKDAALESYLKMLKEHEDE